MTRRWPNATYVEDRDGTAGLAQRIFDTKMWRADQPLRVVLIGTDFEVRVWETLLKIPMGRAVCYSDIANKIKNPKASRAVGAAVGRNPVSFVVPCHRALGKGGALTGYHWGITRKQAMLGWEAGQLGLQFKVLLPKGTTLLPASWPMSARPSHGMPDLSHQWRATSSSFIAKSGWFAVMSLQRPSLMPATRLIEGLLVM